MVGMSDGLMLEGKAREDKRSVVESSGVTSFELWGVRGGAVDMEEVDADVLDWVEVEAEGE